MRVPALFHVLAIICVAHANAAGTCPASSSHCLTVSNHCGETLYLQRTIIDGPENLPTAVTALPAGDTKVIDISEWQGVPSQRLYAWWIDPTTTDNPDPITMRDKAELFLCGSDAAPEMCYNPTAVDYFGLPVRMAPMNTEDCPSKLPTGSKMLLHHVRDRCPTRFESTGQLGVCLSPSRVCDNHNDDGLFDRMCTAFDDVIAQCVEDGNCGDSSTSISSADVYACAGWMANNPQWCAALNRGMYDHPDAQNDSSLFYQSRPFNEYAAWVHAASPRQYAFPYDDYEGGSSSGYQQCTTNHLRIDWCPEDAHQSSSSTARTTTAIASAMVMLLMVMAVVYV